jgi:hypothetical protein
MTVMYIVNLSKLQNHDGSYVDKIVLSSQN